MFSSHTFPSEGSPNHQPTNKEETKSGETKTVRIAPDPVQNCGSSNKCSVDEEKSGCGDGLKEKAGCKYV